MESATLGGTGGGGDTGAVRALVNIKLGNWHACALDSGGKLLCWGHILEEVPIPTGSYVQQAAGGSNYVCTLAASGAASCFGNGPEAPLGHYKSVTIVDGPTPCFVDLAGHPTCIMGERFEEPDWPDGFVFESAYQGQPACGAGRAGVWCERDLEGSVWSETPDWTPVPAGYIRSVVQLGAALSEPGGNAYCGIDEFDEVVCWGSTGSPLPGLRNLTEFVPRPFPGIRVKELDAGPDWLIVRTADGVVHFAPPSLGRDRHIIGTTEQRDVATLRFRDIGVGPANNSACGVLENGRVLCWTACLGCPATTREELLPPPEIAAGLEAFE